MKIPKGATYSWADIEQDEHGFILRRRLRVGSRSKAKGKVKRFRREEELLIYLAEQIDERLAAIGREKTDTGSDRGVVG